MTSIFNYDSSMSLHLHWENAHKRQPHLIVLCINFSLFLCLLIVIFFFYSAICSFDNSNQMSVEVWWYCHVLYSHLCIFYHVMEDVGVVKALLICTIFCFNNVKSIDCGCPFNLRIILSQFEKRDDNNCFMFSVSLLSANNVLTRKTNSEQIHHAKITVIIHPFGQYTPSIEGKIVMQ